MEEQKQEFDQQLVNMQQIIDRHLEEAQNEENARVHERSAMTDEISLLKGQLDTIGD